MILANPAVLNLVFVAILAINNLFVPQTSTTIGNSIQGKEQQQQQHIIRTTKAMATAFINPVDEETTIDSLREQIDSSPIALVLAVASFAPKCKALLADLEILEEDYDSGGAGCCGPSPTTNKPLILVITTDEADELEELAIELGLKDVPSYQIYRDGTVVGSNVEGSVVTVASIREGLQKAAAAAPSSSSCCPPNTTPAVCCPGGSSAAGSAPTDASTVLQLVQQSYAATVNQAGDGGCCVSVDPSLVGYTQEQIIKAGKDANLGLGCGNPMSFANITEGETVLDLGSGAGVDCFLAADVVGPRGQVIGVDMTPDMIHRARRNAADRKSTNVQFRLGEIEHLPVADSTVDCVVSNCVINLSPDKPRVFREIYRILKPGGRVAVSDVVIRPEKIIPDRLKTAEALAC